MISKGFLLTIKINAFIITLWKHSASKNKNITANNFQMDDQIPKSLPHHVLQMSVGVVYLKQSPKMLFSLEWNFQNELPRWFALPQENHQNSTISPNKWPGRETVSCNSWHGKEPRYHLSPVCRFIAKETGSGRESVLPTLHSKVRDGAGNRTPATISNCTCCPSHW